MEGGGRDRSACYLSFLGYRVGGRKEPRQPVIQKTRAGTPKADRKAYIPPPTLL